MASPPIPLRLALEDFTDAPQDFQAGLETLAPLLNPYFSDVEAVLNRRITIGENLAALLKTVDFTPPDDWVPLTPGNGFARHPTTAIFPKGPAVRKAPDGTCRLRSTLERPAGAPPAGTVIFSLGEAYAPEEEVIVINSTNTGPGELRIQISGDVVYVSGGVTAYVLDALTWTAADRRPVPLGKPFPLVLDLVDADGFRLEGEPRVVLPVAAYDASTKSLTAVPFPNMAWEYSRAGSGSGARPAVKITHLSGFTPKVKHRVTFFILS